MISRVELVHGKIHVHLAQISLKTTKSFTHGGIIFDRASGMVAFGSVPPVSLPADIALEDGQTIEMQLVAPDGTLRRQTRTGTVRKAQAGEIYRVVGQAKTPARFSAEDGWTIEVFKYRAYFTHPGLNTTGAIPTWLRESIERQRQLWNRLAWLCREARRQCTPLPVSEIKAFVEGTIIPAIDRLNNTLGRSRERLKYPAKLRVEMPGLDGLWNFVRVLRKRIETGLPVPEGLLDSIIAYTEQFKPDYRPIQEFLSNINKIGEREAQTLGLLRHEIRPTLQSITSVLKTRKTRNMGWSEGWPLIKYPGSPRTNNWALTYYLNRAGLKAESLETAKGIPGLLFGPAKSAVETGHAEMIGAASQRALREAAICLPNRNKEPWEFRFGVLQHRPLPRGSHIKQWQLGETDGKLWLSLTVEVKRPFAAPGEAAAGLDIGWRRTDEGIRIGVLYEPLGGTYKEILLDFQMSPRDHSEREPFRLNLGPTRWERRNINRIIPDWKPGNTLPGTIELRSIFSSRRSTIKDEAKVLLRRHLGENVPAWFGNAGKRGILQLADEMQEDPTVHEIVREFVTRDAELNQLASVYMASSTRRLEYGYEQIAHDICRHIADKGLTRIVMEEGFLQKTMRQEPDKDGDGYYALKNSQKYRQFAAVGKFVAILKQIARKYGISAEHVAAANTTRICEQCGHLNSRTAKQKYQCEGCERLIDQDYNAAVNLSRNASLAELPSVAA